MLAQLQLITHDIIVNPIVKVVNFLAQRLGVEIEVVLLASGLEELVEGLMSAIP